MKLIDIDKMIKKCTVECVSLKDLNIGDYILISNSPCKIIEKYDYNSMGFPVLKVLELGEFEKSVMLWIIYYKITNIEEYLIL